MSNEDLFDDTDEAGASGIRVYPKDVMNHLLLVWAIDYIEHAGSKFKNQRDDAVVVDVVDLDLMDDGEHLIARRCWWRGGVLIRDLREKLGRERPQLVRMGTAPASNGMNDAYVLVPMKGDSDAVARGLAWMQAHPNFRPSRRWASDGGGAGQQPPSEPARQERPNQPSEPPRQESMLERMARQATEANERFRSNHPLPPAPGGKDEPPF